MNTELFTPSKIDSYTRTILEWHAIRSASPGASPSQLAVPDGLDEAQYAINELIWIGNLPPDMRPQDLTDLEPMLEAMYSTGWPRFLNHGRTTAMIRLLPTGEARSRVTRLAMHAGAGDAWNRRDYEMLTPEDRECLIDEVLGYSRSETLNRLRVFDSIAAMQSPRTSAALEHARQAVLDELEDPQGTLHFVQVNERLNHVEALIDISRAATTEQLLALVPYEAERWSSSTKWTIERAEALGAHDEARQLVLDARPRWRTVLRAQVLRARANPPVMVPLRKRIEAMLFGPSIRERVLRGEQIMLQPLKAWGIEAGLLTEDDWTDIPSVSMFEVTSGC